MSEHILWSASEEIERDYKGQTIRFLNKAASERFYDAFEEKIKASKGAFPRGQLVAVSTAEKIEAMFPELARNYILKNGNAEKEEPSKYQDVLDFYEKNYKDKDGLDPVDLLNSLHTNFHLYNVDEWEYISEELDKKFDNYHHEKDNFFNFKNRFLVNKMLKNQSVSLGTKIIPESFLNRLYLIKKECGDSDITDCLSPNRVLVEFTEAVVYFHEKRKGELFSIFEELLKYIETNYNSDNLYCYQVLVDSLKTKDDVDTKGSNVDGLDPGTPIDTTGDNEDAINTTGDDEDAIDTTGDKEEEFDLTGDEEPDLDLTDSEEEEKFTIVKRVKQAMQDPKARKKVKCCAIAGTGIISLLIIVFVFGRNPIEAISRFCKAFKGLFSKNPTFLPFAKRLGDLAAYAGSIIASYYGISKLVDVDKEKVETDEDALVGDVLGGDLTDDERKEFLKNAGVNLDGVVDVEFEHITDDAKGANTSQQKDSVVESTTDSIDSTEDVYDLTEDGYDVTEEDSLGRKL